ncbi:hypothetical protein UPYG_G00258050 [Umbra pygmaea]|uniref:Uncharacterized protein n=1 Tax=Umbra pygmaea TaxID=75934 RepID=A0ABD0WU98_UMBPY
MLNTAVYLVIKRAIMRSQAGLEDKAVEDLITNVLKHAPAHSKLQVRSGPEFAVPGVVPNQSSPDTD